MNTKKNERFAETDRRIRKAFTKMVLNKKTNQISVREICEATGINRSSFYLHYADIPALITAIVEEKWTESVERIHEEMHGDPNIFSEAYVAATLREAKRDRAFYRAYFEKFGTAELEKGYQTLFENVFKPFFRRLGISPETLKRYEGGRLTPPDETVARMCEVYGVRWLALEHAKATDRLGILPELEPKPLPMATISLTNRLRDAADRLAGLLRIAEDGVIDDAERPEFDDIVQDLRETIAAAYQVIYADAKKERQVGGQAV